METREKLSKFLDLLEERDRLLDFYYRFLDEEKFCELSEMFRKEEQLLMETWIPEIYSKSCQDGSLNGYDMIWEWMTGDWDNKEKLVDWLIEYEDGEDYKEESERIGANW